MRSNRTPSNTHDHRATSLAPMRVATVGFFLLALTACGADEELLHEDSYVEDVGQSADAATALDPRRAWTRVTGVLSEVAAQNGPGARWAIDKNPISGGFRVVRWSGDRWVPAASSMGAVRIAVQHNGSKYVPWVIDNQGRIWRSSNELGSSWTQIGGSLRAREIAASTAPIAQGGAFFGPLFVIGTDGLRYRWNGGGFSALGFSGFDKLAVDNCPSFQPQVYALEKATGQVWHSPSWYDADFAFPFFNAGGLEANRVAIASGTPWGGDGYRTSLSVARLAQPQSGFIKSSGSNPGNTGVSETGPFPSPMQPVSMSFDCDRYRIWVVLSDGAVYYGE
jgi:hypothetical protein